MNRPETVALRWVCTAMNRRWSDVFGRYISERCGEKFTIAHAREVYERRMCSARCPSCGAELRQANGDAEVQS